MLEVLVGLTVDKLKWEVLDVYRHKTDTR